ncbi:hypothetical protein IWQ62_004666 [Dispira parvispora]|uniref:Replication factor A protein 3 n=1 Tax=Dispira parvispora TaxID=1520584 RepID=A0A9W8ALY8_9FUNG|nr:hypothetical protein IWQ62_004666 [Dispira parvispora]
MEKPTPRINSAMLPNYINHSVRLVGKIVQHNTFGTKFVEIIGQVQPDRSLQEFSSCNMGDNFDMPTYNKLVELSHRYKELFE